MSDNIPFEIQMEIIKWLPVRPLIQFRSVSKPWKSFIDSSLFIKDYGARHTQPYSFILRCKVCYGAHDVKYTRLVDDDIGTFKVQQQEFASFVASPLLKQYGVSEVVGACHGLLFLYGYKKDTSRQLVIWNPSIGKSFGLALPRYHPRIENVFGFGVCPLTSDPTVIKFVCADKMPWHVEVFTLSSGVWNVIPSGKLLRDSIKLNSSTHVVIDRSIYWGARETTDYGESTTNHMVVSFDLITKEFTVVDLPDSLTNEIYAPVSISKLRGSLVVYGSINVVRGGVWVMEHDLSFRKLYTIGAPFYKILGFRKNGEPLFETREEDGRFSTLNVYYPCSQQIKNLGIARVRGCFFMGSYKESLLLLDHLDSHIYYDKNLSK